MSGRRRRNDGGEVAAQRDAVLDRTVGKAEELDVRHADHLRAPTLLVFTERPDDARLHAVDPRFAARGEHVHHVLALARPPGDRARDAVLEVVGMRDHGHRTLPVFRYRLHGAPLAPGSGHEPLSMRPAPAQSPRHRAPYSASKMGGQRGSSRRSVHSIRFIAYPKATPASGSIDPSEPPDPL